MGNHTSKRRLSNNDDDDDLLKKKRFSFLRHSHDHQVKDKVFDISKEELEEIRNIARRASFTPFYPAYCLVR